MPRRRLTTSSKPSAASERQRGEPTRVKVANVSTQESGRSRPSAREDHLDDADVAAPQDRPGDLDADVDAILDEIDEVLEENAEDFVKSFVQKGGQ